ncbi:hypothetical protein JW979_06440 [bacterium]|nr:hypothetical protein [candidate division CSSED10-310 bacterium]
MRCKPIFVILMLMAASVPMVTRGADFTVQVDALGFYPDPQVINEGDRVRFFNATSSPLQVYQTMGGCMPYWATSSIPVGGTSLYIQFTDCPSVPANEYYNTNPYLGFSDGMIVVMEAPPTPTAGPTETPNLIPATTPAGVGYTLILMGIILAAAVFRRTP